MDKQPFNPTSFQEVCRSLICQVASSYAQNYEILKMTRKTSRTAGPCLRLFWINIVL